MLSFFRQVRSKWVVNASVRKYLLYALGEVILVVFGILIALEVNNWNEQRKSDDRVTHYLLNLRDALQDDIHSLERTYAVNAFRLQGIFYLLREAGLEDGAFTEMEWVDYSKNEGIHGLWNGPYPSGRDREFTNLAFLWLGRGFGGASFNYSIINELYATGSFSDIRNRDLKKELGNYYQFLHQRLEGYAIEEHEEWANEVTRFLRDSYGIFTLDSSSPDAPLERINGKKDVEHQLRYLALEVNYHCTWAAHARDMAESLILEIDREVGSDTTVTR